MNSPDDDWEPPNEATLKIIEAKQDRSNKISKLMSEYMLKGYRMLDKLCAECGTILLQDRNAENYCVTCNELTSELDKDDPAVSEEAAKVAVKELEQNGVKRKTDYEEGPHYKQAPNKADRYNPYQNVLLGEGDLKTVLPDDNKHNTEPGPSKYSNINPSTAVAASPTPNQTIFDTSSTIITNKLQWAVYELNKTTSVESCIQYCNAIKACSEALLAVNSVIKYQNENF